MRKPVMTNRSMSLNAMLGESINNTISEEFLDKIPQSDRTLVENLMLVAQAEIETLNLTTASVNTASLTHTQHITITVCMSGPKQVISMSQLRAIQNYSPARVAELKVQLNANNQMLIFELTDSNTKIKNDQIEVIRICKRRRFV